MNAIETNYEPSTRYLLAKTLVFSFGLLGVGIAALILTIFHDAMIKYSDSLKWLIFITFCILIILVLVFIAVNMFLIVERRAVETEIMKQNNLILLAKPVNKKREKETPLIHWNKTDDDFITDKDQETHDVYQEMIATDTFSLNQMALELYGIKGGEYNKKIRVSLNKFGINI